VAHVSAADRRPQLVDAAIAVMTRDGVAAASTRAIAAELGIAQAMVHYLYGSKDELYRAVIERLSRDLAEWLPAGEPPSDESFRASVAAFAERMWQGVVERPDLHHLLTELVILGLRSPGLRLTIADYQRQLDQAVEETFQRAAQRSGVTPARPIREVARFFAAGLDGLILQRLNRRDDEADLRSLADLVDATVALSEGRTAPEVPTPVAGGLGVTIG
jgi:AcrR family transcriptional regulator